MSEFQYYEFQAIDRPPDGRTPLRCAIISCENVLSAASGFDLAPISPSE
jgi:hypothetical protein